MEKLGHESAQRFIEMSEFKEQRKSVDDVNLAFTESMDMLYAERRDKDMGYDANQIADQDVGASVSLGHLRGGHRRVEIEVFIAFDAGVWHGGRGSPWTSHAISQAHTDARRL